MADNIRDRARLMREDNDIAAASIDAISESQRQQLIRQTMAGVVQSNRSPWDMPGGVTIPAGGGDRQPRPESKRSDVAPPTNLPPGIAACDELLAKQDEADRLDALRQEAVRIGGDELQRRIDAQWRIKQASDAADREAERLEDLSYWDQGLGVRR